MSNKLNEIYPIESNQELSDEFDTLEAFTLREYNCKLDEEIRFLIHQKIEKTLEFAPANHCTIVTLTLEDGEFNGTMNISSYFNSFEADAVGDNPYDVIKSMCREIMDQLHSWKKSRFADEDPTQPHFDQAS